MVELREYQKIAVNEIRSGLAKYRRVVCVMPTGSGKGTVLGYVASLAANKGTKTLILAHREEIMKQNAGHCRKCGVEPQIISPKHRKVPTEGIVCGMVQTLQRRIEKPEWMEYVKSVQMLVLDEAHICNYDFLFDIISDKCYVVGYTATMARYGGMTQAGLQYNAMVLGPSVKILSTWVIFVDAGYILLTLRLWKMSLGITAEAITILDRWRPNSSLGRDMSVQSRITKEFALERRQ